MDENSFFIGINKPRSDSVCKSNKNTSLTQYDSQKLVTVSETKLSSYVIFGEMSHITGNLNHVERKHKTLLTLEKYLN